MERQAAAQARTQRQAKEKRPVKKIRLGLWGKLLVLALIGALGWQLWNLHSRLQEAEAQRAALEDQVQIQQAANDRLQADIDAGGTQAQMEEKAREELGMVAPGDRVFYDVSN